ncbi:hypothetical protein GCM10010082_11400 [Kushneria pakistanensis]|uniref:Uncharacterized protein n=1 Tax=Kushneria pakistanensis TaxID=1508770 RepID=A0ABQ3FEQ7_9GAMM|nr:hypothetical protein GCM10010082_11400 [Kushneria pakistanensis]
MVFTLVTLSALLAGPLNTWRGWQLLNLWLLVVVALMAWAVTGLNRRTGAMESENTPASS